MQGKSVNFRGTSGTGKTTIMRHFLELGNFTPFVAKKHFNPKPTKSGKERKPRDIICYRGFLFGRDAFILGNYGPTNGGCDTIPSVSLSAELLRTFFTAGNLVLFEGLMISHMLGTVGAAQEELGKEHNVLAFLDTPLHDCLHRVQQRRLARGDTRPFNETNTRGDHEAVWNCKNRATDLGFRVVEIDHLDAVNQAHALVEEVANESQ